MPSLHRDYPLVTAAFIFISAGVVFFNVLTDGVTAWLDPRIQTPMILARIDPSRWTGG